MYFLTKKPVFLPDHLANGLFILTNLYHVIWILNLVLFLYFLISLHSFLYFTEMLNLFLNFFFLVVNYNLKTTEEWSFYQMNILKNYFPTLD